ncbi:hypothetical protein EJ06DRAFT_52008 [Trichodelitschia bisporula]|uniref:Uncharacterized protein n=1 Tax=Trichodelitschia bisporula TaxID=703511 RepID=A0A6G1HUB8_9PEZI|nr:hypothetical protein EJ06DRAFT_52008 [Trichodelitschia bisporula]
MKLAAHSISPVERQVTYQLLSMISVMQKSFAPACHNLPVLQNFQTTKLLSVESAGGALTEASQPESSTSTASENEAAPLEVSVSRGCRVRETDVNESLRESTWATAETTTPIFSGCEKDRIYLDPLEAQAHFVSSVSKHREVTTTHSAAHSAVRSAIPVNATAHRRPGFTRWAPLPTHYIAADSRGAAFSARTSRFRGHLDDELGDDCFSSQQSLAPAYLIERSLQRLQAVVPVQIPTSPPPDRNLTPTPASDTTRDRSSTPTSHLNRAMSPDATPPRLVKGRQSDRSPGSGDASWLKVAENAMRKTPNILPYVPSSSPLTPLQ